MNNLEKCVKIVLVGWCIVTAKLYAEMRYYQGRIDARKETIQNLENLRHDLEEKIKENEEA
jgi:outer membrane protein TolC